MEDDTNDTGDDGIEYGQDDASAADHGDDSFEAALREFQEETGHDLSGQGGSEDVDGAEPKPDAGPPKGKPVAPGSKDSVVRRMQLAEERSLRLEQENKALKAERQVQKPPASSGDLLDDLWSNAAQRLGVDRSDPKVRALIYELTGDVMAELEPDSDDPHIQARLEKRRRDRERITLQSQIDEMKRDRETREKAALMEQNRSNGIATMRQHLESINAADEYPHLYAAEDDPIAAAFSGLQTLVAAGHTIDDSNAEDTIAYVLSRIDAEHRTRLERLEAAKSKRSGGKPPSAPIQPHREPVRTPEKTRGAREDRAADRREDRGGRTVTASGVGMRRVPVAAKSDAEKTPDEVFEDSYREFQEEQRRLRARPGRH